MALFYFLVRVFVLVTFGPILLVLLAAVASAEDGLTVFLLLVLALVPAAFLCGAFWPEQSKKDGDGDSPLDVEIKVRRAGRGEYDATVTPRRRHAP
ncbi:MAG: hypothetical protein J4F40_13490 [Alphaproteobacteria bacterium]|nr:hypothetical protein [Alphaproteobacteria bacterium]